MGLFDRFKGQKGTEGPKAPEAAPEVWENAFKANINFYGKEGEETFGALVLTEGTETILPTTPWEKYGLDGKPVADWRLVLVSITDQGIIGMLDYRTAMEKLGPYIQDRRGGLVLPRGLSLQEMKGLLGNHP